MCFTEPIIGALISTFIYKKKPNPKVWWLCLMFYGGAVFGIVDHLWNGELFAVPTNLSKDLLLGAVISAVILISWGVLVAFSKPAVKTKAKAFKA